MNPMTQQYKMTPATFAGRSGVVNNSSNVNTNLYFAQANKPRQKPVTPQFGFEPITCAAVCCGIPVLACLVSCLFCCGFGRK